MSSYYSLLYQQIGPIDSLKVVSADAFMYVSTTGNDTSGTGSTAAPFRTLKKAVSFAREHLILGDATLTIRLLPGEYTIDENLDLYHPQGANLVIEGDPDAFKQRVVWRVQNYNWNIANFAQGGHGATLSLFDGTTSGCTFHGFTASDNGKYFTIVNASVGSRSGYATDSNGISLSSESTYDPIFYGDRFFNHGYSYEEGNAILGLGKIGSAEHDPYTISARFTCINYDGRCPAWQTNGGLGNGSPVWAGLGSNYPETQYSQPNGYYGTSTWRNESGDISYPPKPSGAAHISTDPFIMSTYPVVIRSAYNRNTGTLYLKNGNLKAIRNIMFVANELPYISATANHTQAISAFTDNKLAHDTNGTGLLLENSSVGIRHLGFYGMGTAISAHGSKITKYSESTVDISSLPQTGSEVGGTVRKAILNSLDNAPIICTANCQNGIVAKNSTVDFTDSSGTSREYLTDHRDSTVHISALSKPISLFGSTLKTTSVVADTHSMIPAFKMDVVVPVFSAMPENAFDNYAGKTAFWSAYPLAKAFVNLSDSGRQEIGIINYITQSNAGITGIGGITLGATYIGSVSPTEYKRYTIHGLKTASEGLGGLAYMTEHDVRNGITTEYGLLQTGGALEIEFYADNSATTVASYYGLQRNGIVVRGITGSTYGIVGTNSSQFSNCLQSFSSYGADGTYLGNYFEDRKSCVQAFDGSSVVAEKALVLNNTGAVSVEVAKNSSLIVGDGIISANKSLGVQGTGTTDGRVGSMNYNSGAVCITGYALAGIHCWDNSKAIIGTVFTKHPTSVNCFQENDLSLGNKVIKLEQSSQAIVGSLYSLLSPGNASVLATSSSQTRTTLGSGYWRSRTGIGYGFVPFDSSRPNGFVSVEKNSSLILEVASGAKVFHFDGGSPNWSGGANFRNVSLITAKADSSVLVGDVQQSTTAYTNSNLGTAFTVDGRTAASSRIATRSNGTAVSVYATPTNNRAWVGFGATASNFQIHDVNIGNYSDTLTNSNGQKDVPPLEGVTYCTSFSGFSRIIGI